MGNLGILIIVLTLGVFFYHLFRPGSQRPAEQSNKHSPRLFGQSKRIAALVTEDVAPLVRSLSFVHGRLSPTVFLDHYVMGFIHCSLAIHIALHSKGGIQGEQAGYVLMNITNAFFGEHGSTFLRIATDLQTNGSSSEFSRGVENAKKTWYIGYGIAEFKDDPDVNAARREAALDDPAVDAIAPGASEQSKVAGLLQSKLFGEYIIQKFGPGSDPWDPEDKSEKETKVPSEPDRNTLVLNFVSESLMMQVILFKDENSPMPPKSMDDWSIGYVAGFADAAFQNSGIPHDGGAYALMTLIFINIFEGKGPDLFGKLMDLQASQNKDVMNGMIKGGREFNTWIGDHDTPPLGWSTYVSDGKK